MSWIRFLYRRHWDQERARELEAYLETETDENIARGMSPQEARYAAHRKLGNTTRIREEIYRMNSLGWIENFFQDVRFALRMLRKSPGFTAVAVFTLALGIGATTAIFTVVNAVLLRPLPYPHPEQLVIVQEILENFGPTPFAYVSEFAAWRDQSRILSPVAAYTESWFNLTGGGDPERITAGLATSSFFSSLGVHPVIGRLFLPEEDHAGGPLVALLSEPLWRSRYAGDPSVVGRGVTLDGEVYTVVGVLPRNFVVPAPFHHDFAIWVPLIASATGPGNSWREQTMGVVQVIGRLKPGGSLEAARSELNTILRSTRAGGPGGWVKGVILSTWQEQTTEKSRLSLLLFLGAVGFLLLIACANVANLLLARAASRQKEITVRLAVGAGRTRIVRQLLTESTLLALLGGLLGLLLARWGKDLLVAFMSPNLPALGPVVLDYRVLVFSLILAALTGIAFGMAPAFRASRVSLNEVLKEASRSTSESRSGLLLRNLLVMGETALAMMLLVGAGLLFRSFLRVRGIDMGFKSGNVLCMTVDLTASHYATPKAQLDFFQQVMEKIRGLEGVQAVAGSSCPPLGIRTMSATTALRVEGQLVEVPDARTTAVSPDYFRAMGIALTQGRYFTEADGATSASVAIVDESFARRYCPGERCLGGRIGSWVRRKDVLTIVGIVANARDSADAAPHPKVYLPFAQASEPFMTVLVRTAGDSRRWVAAVRAQVASVDKDQPPHDMMTLDELRSQSLTPRRVNMLLVGVFAALGLILACVGIYGVVSYSVSQRAHEIGVRMALGAERADVLSFIVRQGLSVTLGGVVLGLIGARLLTRFLSSLLYGVKATDSLTFAAVAILLIVVAILANFLPARRATKVDPMVALRYE